MLSGLQDGIGAAKIDLRPGSHFLNKLNARSWPASVPIRIIGALLAPYAPTLGDGMVAGSHRGMLKRLSDSEDEPAAIPLILELLEASSGP